MKRNLASLVKYDYLRTNNIIMSAMCRMSYCHATRVLCDPFKGVVSSCYFEEVFLDNFKSRSYYYLFV